MATTNGTKADHAILELLAKLPGLVEAAATPEAQTALLQQAVRLRGSIGKGRARRKTKTAGYQKVKNSVLD